MLTRYHSLSGGPGGFRINKTVEDLSPQDASSNMFD
jgi:hypothetical protein